MKKSIMSFAGIAVFMLLLSTAIVYGRTLNSNYNYARNDVSISSRDEAVDYMNYMHEIMTGDLDEADKERLDNLHEGCISRFSNSENIDFEPRYGMMS